MQRSRGRPRSDNPISHAESQRQYIQRLRERANNQHISRNDILNWVRETTDKNRAWLKKALNRIEKAMK